MKILVVDDNEDARVLQETVLKVQGYTVESAVNGKQALEMARRSRPDMIISDILMPEMDGFAFCQEVKSDEKLKTIPFVFYSGSYTSSKDKELTKALGASRFILKTTEVGEFIKTIEEVLEEYKQGRLQIPSKPAVGTEELDGMHREALIRKLSEKVHGLEKEREALKESEDKLKDALRRTIQALAATVEARDPYTAGHQQRVGDISCAIAAEMGLPEDQIEGIRLAGIIHDIGKMSVPADILTKPGRLTEMEISIIRTHSHVGYDILEEIEFPWPVADMVLQHQERMDGSGYPQPNPPTKMMKNVTSRNIHLPRQQMRPPRMRMGPVFKIRCIIPV